MRPGDTLGVLGGGQLGRMMCLAAARLGLRTHVYCPDADSPAFEVATTHTVAAYDDMAALAAFAAAVGVVTYEFENVPVAAVRGLANLAPSADALEASQDRLGEKGFLAACGLPVAPHRAVGCLGDLVAAVDALGEGILKTRRLGYDGKGQVRVRPGDSLSAARAAIGGAEAIFEGLVPFVAETSTVLARAADGTTAAYAAPRNTHAEGILRTSELPGPLTPALQAHAAALTATVAARLGYVGVLTIEWFVTSDPEKPLVANEMAPRVHNSGHWTEDGAVTSQFENHVRAVVGWPLGDTARTRDVTMRNLIGADVDDFPAYLDNPAARPHLYGKRETRAGRKMGHVNLLGSPVGAAKVDSDPGC